MKWRVSTMRRFTRLHGWAGLMAGMALFVAFLAGSLTVFQQDVVRWAQTGQEAPTTPDLHAADRLLQQVLAQHPGAHGFVGMTLPGSQYALMSAYWMDAQGTWQYATPTNLAGRPTPPGPALPEVLNELHYSLAIPGVGEGLMGLISLIYAVALISGLVIHLPQLGASLFALRRGRNLKRFWQDTHNILGVLGLPFHLVFAATGAAICLLAITVATLNPLAFQGRLTPAAVAASMNTAPLLEPSTQTASMQPLPALVRRVMQTARRLGLEDFQPSYLKLTRAGTRNAVLEITGTSRRGLGAGAVALDAHSGQVLATQLPGQRDANHATLAGLYALHYGDYGNRFIAWLYFALGLAGAFVFYSGNLLWIESRRKRRRTHQARGPTIMAKATVGICLGLCVAVAGSFLATQLLPAAQAASAPLVRGLLLALWAGCVVWASWRPPLPAARALLWTAAALALAVALAHGISTGWWPWRAASHGLWSLFGVDMVALLAAFALAVAARATGRRARSGPEHSVWADPHPGANKV